MIYQNSKPKREFLYLAVLFCIFLPIQSLAQNDSPCECAHRWVEGAHWNANGTIDDAPNSPPPHGIIRCGNSAETESGVMPGTCVYNSSQFTIDLTGHTCLNPNTMQPVNVTPPVNGCPVIWHNFDVRSSAGSYEYQIVTNDNIGWALYVSTEHQNGLDPSGLSGNCSSLTFWACGNSFNNTFATFSVPSFLQATNCYLAIWDQDCSSPTNYDVGDFSVNFKARFGCGDADFIICIVEAGNVTSQCNDNGTYTISIPINGANGNYQGSDPNATPTTSSIVTLKNLGAGGPTSGTITITYPQSVTSYNVTIQDVVAPADDIVPINPDSCILNVTGNGPVCDPCANVDCDDDDVCTTDLCNNGDCSNTPINCNDDNACTDDSCDKNLGCQHSQHNCNDNNACTIDNCNPQSGCTYSARICDDDDFCTTNSCDALTGCVYTPIICDDYDFCTTNSCEASTGCVYTPIICNDDVSCTSDACVDGQCVYTPGLLGLDIQKQDMSCRCYNSQNQLCALDFSGLAHGETLNNQYAAYGIHVFAKPTTIGSTVTRPVVFNSNLSGTADPDLEVDLGNILILPVAPGVPDDDEAGGEITFNFDQARTVLSFVAIDFDNPNCDCTLTLYDATNAVIKVVQIPNTGNGGYLTVPVNAAAVRSITFRYNDSGGIADIRFACDEPCCDGSATANPSGGSAPYSYQWTNGQQNIGTNATISGLCPGTYYVTVTDENGCHKSGSVTIENPDPNTCTECNPDCNGDCNGSAYYDNCQQCVGGNTGKQPCTPPCNLQVESLTLVYEGLLGDIGQLTDGMTINSNNICRFNIRANTCPSIVGSVKFVLNNYTTKIENAAPYAFFGDNAGSYKPWMPTPGSYTLVVTAHSGTNASGQAGSPVVVHFTVTGSQAACGTPPSVCQGGCNDNNPCTTDACVNSNCVFTQVNCDDGNPCTADACVQGSCTHTPVLNEPSYLRVVNPSKSWRKLKLGYSNNLWSPKQNVSAGGNNQMCITLRTVGTPEWNKIQVRPQGTSSATVTLSNYISGAQTGWTTICIPLSAFNGFNFSSISFIEIPYSNGANAFEIHIQRIVFSGGSSPFLWFGDPHTGNYHDGGSGSTSALIATLIPGHACGSKLSEEEGVEQMISNHEKTYISAYPNPFKEQLNFEFSVIEECDVTLELFSITGAKIATIFEGKAKSAVLYKEMFHRANHSDGLYIYKLKTSSSLITEKVLMMH